ncbi:RibD family protein [Tumidithrix elongata RA019]|uniref:RibD family protein n=1 Tax=Tumidithrix elongata BACA0141 TaxID=2716417 RepID=A0AAW9Q5A6_9CYAN|nr:RibD family protein [Tumidithrix elongata RA019]
MFNGLYTSHDLIYTFEELGFSIDGVPFFQLGEPRTRPYIVFNMVSSVDGKATTHAGELTGLGSRPDRKLMQRLRSQVDGVLVGGGTLRVDPFIPTIPQELAEERSLHFPDHPQPLGIVVSNRGNLPAEHQFWAAGRDLRVVFLGGSALESVERQLSQKAIVVQLLNDTSYSANGEAASGEVDLGEMLHILFTRFGVRRLLVEGGPSLNYAFISQGWCDELFLTLSPRLVGGVENSSVIAGAGYGMGTGDLPKLKLRSLYHHEDELFLRYQIQSPA